MSYDVTRYDSEGYSSITGKVHWSMEMIRRANADAGHHWFEPDTMRFFRSRVGWHVYQGKGGVYFVSSEQYRHFRGGLAPRAYTLRQFHPETGRVDTVGRFQAYRHRSTAIRAAQRAAEGR